MPPLHSVCLCACQRLIADEFRSCNDLCITGEFGSDPNQCVGVSRDHIAQRLILISRHVMYQQRYQNKTRKQDCYICGSYKKRTRDCTAHFIRTDLLTAGVLSNLRQVTEYAAKHESRFVKLLIQQNEIGGKRKTAAATKQLEQAQERISEVSRIIKRLYEDNVNGKISDERFMELSADYEQELINVILRFPS